LFYKFTQSWFKAYKKFNSISGSLLTIETFMSNKESDEQTGGLQKLNPTKN